MGGLRLCIAALVVGSACGEGEITGKGGDDGPPPIAARCEIPEPTGAVFYVATDGSNGADGSSTAPWATITHAVQTVPDGATVLVGPGTYEGRVELRGRFATGITVRSETPYAARLRNDGTVIRGWRGEGIAIEGFDIAHSGPGAGALVIHIQDLIGDEPGGAEFVKRITLRNNIIHDSYNNDLVKINNGAGDITVEGNVLYNQSGSDEHIDINSVGNVVVQDNVFFNDFAASGRSNDGDTSSFIVIKDSNADDDSYLGAENVIVRRNVFANWQGANGSNFVLVGEDGNPYFEATDVLFENNLLIGNSSDEVRAPFGVKGGRNINFRNNTVVGDMPGGAFAFRFNQEGDNPANENIELYNNIWADPTGTMGDFSDTPGGEVTSFSLDNNLYFNAGRSIQTDDGSDIAMTDDENAIIGDPGLPAQGDIAMPVWDPDSGRFATGATDTCGAFEQLAEGYGAIAADSPARGAARRDEAPNHDILGNPRTTPSVGAYEP